MKQQLAQLTGLGGNAASARAPMPQRQPARTIQPVARRSLVRGAIAVLLQQPSLALTLGGKHHFQGLRLPGVELLLELLGLVEQRPDISTGALLEHFDGRTARRRGPAGETAAGATSGGVVGKAAPAGSGRY
ncbi:hypothetical protein G6F62_015082 [Rhizopus arrhizus]|nr:hypothetical protein G6F62_015082 [Rhizopus arrhizus]